MKYRMSWRMWVSDVTKVGVCECVKLEAMNDETGLEVARDNDPEFFRLSFAAMSRMKPTQRR